ncbi:hypothetical protein ISN45_Aa03g036650 [Arabidopsis thaliana x Arabidopsis arenosa]|uniref:Uncharacterized protein n=1 Tax=Arabidopsis thaliana x Arabidopsis arenosa TaxID=1240361 RepID=A0A8T2AXW0_9BRAS|nr:hypothetical protein ISN45_Aa03g036650 [Arabidopsis thaliana x Arabidopsis arenosa]
MSRCYPFPPPGYVRKESLIESIKGEKEEVKKDRKHKRKEKERKDRENEAGRSRKHRHKRRRKDEGTNASGSGKLINSEVEFLEKSCQTVELELQTSSQTSCDSTLHSNERPKQIQSQPLDGRHNDSGELLCVYLLLGLFAYYGVILSWFQETGIRTWLHDKGQEDPEDEVMMTSKDQKQRFSGEMLDASQAAAPTESAGHLYSTRQDALRVCEEKRRDPIFGSTREITTKLSKEKKSVPLKDNRKFRKEKPTSSHQETPGPSKRLCRKCPPSMAGELLNLIENWAPDRVESKLADSEDQEWWLFIKFGAKRQQISNQRTNQGSSSMVWPTARFLPEAEVHALPFTVPF